MTPAEQFVLKIITQDYEGVLSAIQNGFDVNTQIPGRRPIVESAQTSEDYRMLHILFTAGAKASTPWLEKVFEQFRKGISPPPAPKAIPEAADLTNRFSAKHLEFLQASMHTVDHDGCTYFSFDFPVSPFKLDGEIIQTSLRLDFVTLPASIANWAQKIFRFPANPTLGYIDASIYIRHVHNPVFIREIKFGKLVQSEINVALECSFEFEVENTGFPNEDLRVQTWLKL